MIKNDRQYRLTKAAVSRFRDALRELEATGNKDLDPRLVEANRDALRSQLDELHAELRDYEDLVGGTTKVLELGSLADLPEALIRARIAARMSHRDLAERLGLKEQQIQRYEATDYQQASLARLVEVAKALGLQVRKDLFLPGSGGSPESFFARLQEFGLSKDFVVNRLAPRQASASLEPGSPQDFERFTFETTRAVSRVLGWTPAAILGQLHPSPNSSILGAARFKLNATADEKFLSVYTLYAHYLALLLLKATPESPAPPVSKNPEEVRAGIIRVHGEVSLRGALMYCWDIGVPVLPLSDPGAFHGAFWRVAGRNVIVLKQKTRSLSRWLFDLLHELRHAAEEPGALTRQTIEEPETSIERLASEEEQDAMWFAGEVMLGGRAEELVKTCVARAEGSIPRLKAIVPKVAAESNVDGPSLANYLAFRLSLQGENWWGAATNLQPRDENPWEIARDLLLQRIDLSRLHGLDRELFEQGLRTPEG